MGTVYSSLLARLVGLAGDSAPFIVPAGEVWVVRQISWAPHVGLVNVEVSMTGQGAVTMWRSSTDLLNPTDGLVEGRWVIEPGDFFQLHATFAVDFYVSGYRLLLP